MKIIFTIFFVVVIAVIGLNIFRSTDETPHHETTESDTSNQVSPAGNESDDGLDKIRQKLEALNQRIDLQENSGDFVDVDKIDEPNLNTDDPVIEVGEFVDVNDFVDTSDGIVREVGEFVEVSDEFVASSADQQTTEVGDFVDADEFIRNGGNVSDAQVQSVGEFVEVDDYLATQKDTTTR